MSNYNFKKGITFSLIGVFLIGLQPVISNARPEIIDPYMFAAITALIQALIFLPLYLLERRILKLNKNKSFSLQIRDSLLNGWKIKKNRNLQIKERKMSCNNQNLEDSTILVINDEHILYPGDEKLIRDEGCWEIYLAIKSGRGMFSEILRSTYPGKENEIEIADYVEYVRKCIKKMCAMDVIKVAKREK